MAKVWSEKLQDWIEDDMVNVEDEAITATDNRLDEVEGAVPFDDDATIQKGFEVIEEAKKPIGKEEITNAFGILQEYKSAKAILEARIVDEEEFYMLQQNRRAMAKAGEALKQEEYPVSGWLFNSIINKHADIMDACPEAICLPREASDDEEAKNLTSIMPVVLEQNDWEKAYNDESLMKLKHGTGAYSVLWNPELDNGLGNIDINAVDILNLFWEPGIRNIQESQNFFSVEVVDIEALEREYPQFKGSFGTSALDIRRYSHNTNTDLTKKALVVDWYYKKNTGGKTTVHFCKFTDGNVLYASENDPVYAESGYYEHGKYPFVFDVLFPEEGTPVGFGHIAIGRDSQVYIDKLDKAVLEHAMKCAAARYYVNDNAGVNEDEFNDWTKPLVHVQGRVDEETLKAVYVPSMPSFVVNEREFKVDELKETSFNRDFSNGSTASGVTSGAAIATLQEAGNKVSRDTIKGSYRAFVEVVRIAIELIRQFYTEQRSFRIKNPNGGAGYEFVEYDNSGLQPQPVMTSIDGTAVPVTDETGEAAVRLPIIDIDVKAQKQSPFTTVAQNETAMNLYNAGFFEPERAQQAMICLEMMSFEGKEKVFDYVQQGQTLLNQVNQLNQQIMMASQALFNAGFDPTMFGLMPIAPAQGGAGGPVGMSGNPISTAMSGAEAAQSGYTKKLVDAARP